MSVVAPAASANLERAEQGMKRMRALGFLPKLCRRLLGEELQMPNVATWWCGQPAERAMVERELENLAIAPAFNGPGADGGADLHAAGFREVVDDRVVQEVRGHLQQESA